MAKPTNSIDGIKRKQLVLLMESKRKRKNQKIPQIQNY